MRLLTTLTAIVALLAAPAWVEAQAIVGYGINVARAGAVGVGTGAGVGGIFSTLKGTTDSAGKAGGTVNVSSRNRPEFEEDDLEPKTVIKLPKRDQAKLSTGSSRRTIKGGVVISGVPASNARTSSGTTVRVHGASGNNVGAAAQERVQWDVGDSGGRRSAAVRGAPRAAPQPVRQASRDKSQDRQAKTEGAPATAASDSKPEPSDQDAAGSQPAAETAASDSPGAATVMGPTRIIAAPLLAGGTVADAPRPLDEEAADDDLEIEIELGEDVAAVIERFGHPSMVLKGIFGQDYTEKYTFRTKQGRKIVVLALNGKVTAITSEPLRLAARR